MVSYLTGISTFEQWEKGVLYGPLFENFIVADIFKQILHNGLNYNLYYFRTNHGDEIDLIIDKGVERDLVEIKASVTYRPGFQKTLEKYDFDGSNKKIIYQGKSSEKTGGIMAENYKSFLTSFAPR